MVLEVSHKLDNVKTRFQLYIEELKTEREKLIYNNANYEIVQLLSKNIERIEDERQVIINMIVVLNTILSYYEKCESDNVLICFDETCNFNEKKSEVVDLEKITGILKEIKCI